MKTLLKRLMFFIVGCVVLLHLIILITVSSTRYTNKLEIHLFRHFEFNEWGHTYQRSIDLQQWINDQYDNKGLILGSSTAYRNINPIIINENSSISWFNCGSNAQTINTTLSILDIIIKQTNVDYIILDTYHSMMNHGTESVEDWVSNSTLNFSQKLKLLITNKNFKIRLIVKSYYLYFRKIIKGNNIIVTNKKNGIYLGRGFVYSQNQQTSVLKDEIIQIKTNYSQNKYLEKLIATCKKNNIRLILHNPRIINKVQTNDLVKIAKDNDALFIDGQSIYSSNDSVNYWYYDDHHNTGLGANHNSKLLALELQKLGVR